MLLATWAQLSAENKAVFECFAFDFVEEYRRRKADAATAETQALLESGEADHSNSDQKQA